MEIAFLPVPLWIFATVNVIVISVAIALYSRLQKKIDEHSFSITNIDYWAARVDAVISRQEKAERRKRISYIVQDQANDSTWTRH